MPIVSTDIVAYAAANHPADDVSTVGGAINAKERVEFTDIAANDDIEIISSSASDTQNCTVIARGADGSLSTQTAALTGTTAKIFNTLGVAGVIERVESVILASDAVGTVTVRRSVAGTTIGVIPIGERGFRRLFVTATSDPSATRTYYEKFFIKNNHSTLALLSAVISESADPTGLITFALGTAKGDTVTAANRLTVPGSVSAFDNAAKNVPVNGQLSPGETIAVWAQLSLAANNAPNKSTWTVQAAGASA